MPIRSFWLLSQNINRIDAQKDLRGLSLSIYSRSDSTEAVTEYRERLILEMGDIFEYAVDQAYLNQEKLDRAGLESLRSQVKR